MVRTQIQLTERQARRVRDAARRKGVSIAELIRRALDDALAESERQQQPLAERALSVIGCVNSGLGDLAANHDDYLTDAFQG